MKQPLRQKKRERWKRVCREAGVYFIDYKVDKANQRKTLVVHITGRRDPTFYVHIPFGLSASAQYKYATLRFKFGC